MSSFGPGVLGMAAQIAQVTGAKIEQSHTMAPPPSSGGLCERIALVERTLHELGPQLAKEFAGILQRLESLERAING